MEINLEVLKEFSGNIFPHGLGAPFRCNNFGQYYIANSVEDMVLFMKQFNYTNCYMSIYPYKEYTQENRNSESAIINCIVFDFDDEEQPANALEDTKKLLRWAKRNEISVQIDYSGSKGFHVMISFEPVALKRPKESLKKFAKDMQEAAQFKTLDMTVIGDLERIIRIPGSRHGKTGRYCIPLDPTFFPYLTITDIVSMADKPSDFVPVRKPAQIIADKLLEYDAIIDKELCAIEESKIIASNFNNPLSGMDVVCTSSLECAAYDDYIANGAIQGTRDYAVCGIVHYCKKQNMNYDETAKIVLEFAARCQPKLNTEYTLNRLKAHWTKTYSPCTFFGKVNGLCDKCAKRRRGN